MYMTAEVYLYFYRVNMTTPIKTDPSCMDDFDPNSLSVDQALGRISSMIDTLQGLESIAIRSALGRVTAADVPAAFDVPPHCNSSMDGYAVRSADLPADGQTALDVVGRSMAGHPYDGPVAPGQCVRIMTGAMMPPDTDTVIMQEHAERDGDSIRIDASHKTGQNVRYPGDDIRKGSTLLPGGHRLMPADLGVLASQGLSEVSVRRRPRVAFFSTGDELRSVGQPLGPGDIYDSNRYTLHGMLTRLGAEILDMGVIPDERDAVRQAFKQASELADVVITSGGVSVGEADFVKETLDELGEVGFWKIAMKPGRPLAFGRINQAWFFGLPGNPVSVMATFYQFVQPALKQLMGMQATRPVRTRARCLENLKKRPGRLEYQRGILSIDENGQAVVSSTGLQESHVLTSMSQANCFIILPLETNGAAAGDWVEVEPFEGLV